MMVCGKAVLHLQGVCCLTGDVRERLGHMRARRPVGVGARVLSSGAWAFRLSLRGIPSGHGLGEDLWEGKSMGWAPSIRSGSFA